MIKDKQEGINGYRTTNKFTSKKYEEINKFPAIYKYFN